MNMNKLMTTNLCLLQYSLCTKVKFYHKEIDLSEN